MRLGIFTLAATGLIGLLAWLLPRWGETGDAGGSTPAGRPGETGASTETPPTPAPAKLRVRPGQPQPRAVDPAIIARLRTPEAAAGFAPSDLCQLFEDAGYTTFLEDGARAYEGDRGALSRIFRSPPTDGAASEGFFGTLQELAIRLGDRYFADRLSRESPEVRRRVLEGVFWDGWQPHRADDEPPAEPPAVRGHSLPACWKLVRELRDQPE